MVTVKLRENPRSILTFDGHVLEPFPGDWRKHIGLITKIELLTDRKGQHTLSIQDRYSKGELTVDEGAVPKVTQLIAAVQKAQAEFKFD